MTDTPPPPPVGVYHYVEYYCQHCGARIGREVSADGKVYLRIGVMLATHFSGRCVNCNTPFHWHQDEAELKRLVNRGKEIERQTNKDLDQLTDAQNGLK